jgi:hypothetical protein
MFDQEAIVLAQFLQATLQRAPALLQNPLLLGSLGGDQGEGLDAQELGPARSLFAVLQHSAKRESKGPRSEGKGRVVPVELSPEVHCGVLEDLMGVVDVGYQCQDIPEDLALPFDEKPDESLRIVSRNGGR